MTLNTPNHQALCLKCLACCKILAIPSDRFLLTQDDIELYEARGCKLKVLDGKFYIVMPYPCPHLTPQGCDIYDKRPKSCEYYDGRMDPLVAGECLWREEDREKI